MLGLRRLEQQGAVAVLDIALIEETLECMTLGDTRRAHKSPSQDDAV